MAAGHPLTDEDRWPWLDTIAAWIDERVVAGEPAVVTCSALKKIYRDKLRRQGAVFVYMQGTFDEAMERLERRISELQLELKQCEGQQGRTGSVQTGYSGRPAQPVRSDRPN